jgi:hypothetical protein
MHKRHDGSDMGYASPGKKITPHKRFGNTGTQMVNTPSNIQAWGLHTPWKDATAHCDMTRQDCAWQEALTHHLMAASHRTVQGAG